jgi:hypothetical protein
VRLLLSALILACGGVQAQSVVCHVDYGGASRRIEAQPTEQAYEVPTVQVGSYFLFKLVVEKEDEKTGVIKTYVYADRDAGPVPLHQAIFSWPVLNIGAYGFSGLHFVYEPVRDGELRYWCELSEPS